MAERQNNVRLTASLDGKQLGVMQGRKGGGTDSASTTYPMGGGGPRRPLGGEREEEPVSCTQIYDTVAQANEAWARSRCGRGQLVLKEQPLDDENNAIGEGRTWTGVLKKVVTSDRDSSSGGAQTITYEMTTGSVA